MFQTFGIAAHTVIIKGVKLFQTNGWQEYSDLDIMQMMGRAVRIYKTIAAGIC